MPCAATRGSPLAQHAPCCTRRGSVSAPPVLVHEQYVVSRMHGIEP